MLRFLCALGLACALLAPGMDAAGQTRRRTTGSRSTRRGGGGTAMRTGNSPVALADARRRVAAQIKLLTRFLYLFGRVSSGVEATEAQARRGGELPAQAAATLDRNKNALRDNLRNVRDGLDQLELYIRTTPGLERYSASVQGVAAGAARAEDQAAANQLDAAGRTLLDVVSRLADVLEGLN